MFHFHKANHQNIFTVKSEFVADTKEPEVEYYSDEEEEKEPPIVIPVRKSKYLPGERLLKALAKKNKSKTLTDTRKRGADHHMDRITNEMVNLMREF